MGSHENRVSFRRISLPAPRSERNSADLVDGVATLSAICRSAEGAPSRWRSKGDAKKGTGRKTSENVMINRSPSPQPHFVRGPPPPLPWMSSEVQKRGKLVREVSCVPLWPSPTEGTQGSAPKTGSESPMHSESTPWCTFRTLRARRPKALVYSEHHLGTFRPGAPWHSCKWPVGSQGLRVENVPENMRGIIH